MKVLIISIVLLLCVIHVHSQTHPIQKPLLRGQKPYFVKDQFYNFNELEFLFKDDKELTRLHRGGVRNDVVAKVFGYTTLSLWGVGALTIALDNSPTDGLINTGDAIGLMLIFLVSPLTGTIGLIANSNEVYKKETAIERYNHMNADQFGRNVETPKLGLAKSGVGIMLYF